MNRSAAALIGLLASALLPAQAQAATDGYIDGIYECQVRIEGQFSKAYITLNGRRDGRLVLMVAAEGTSSLFGYGLGTFDGKHYQGNSGTGHLFDMTVAPGPVVAEDGRYAQVRLTGVLPTLDGKKREVNAHLDCTSIW